MELARRVSLLVALTMAVTTGCTTGVGDGNLTTFGPLPTSSDPPGVTTFEETMGSEADSGVVSMGGSADDSTSTPADPDTTTGNPGTTTSSEECNPPCAVDEMCVLGACEPIDSTTGAPACNDVPGNYEGCLGAGNVVDTSGCGGSNDCLTAGDPTIAGVCTRSPCADECECPGAPATGTAPVTCGPITGGPANFCYLDCAAGQSCPTGMVCFGDAACVWPGEGADGVPYGDCFNNGPSTCGLDGICLTDGMAPTVGVCTQDCAGAGSCPASPGGTAPVSCEDVTGDGMNECILDCSGGGSCPAGMTCFSAFLCMWD